jgi:hypothetical protein
MSLLRCDQCIDKLVLGALRNDRSDFNCTGLKPLRYFTLKIDRQQPVLHVSALHFDRLAELEAHRCRGR